MSRLHIPKFLEYMVEDDARYQDLAAFSEPIGMVPDVRNTGELIAFLEDRGCGSGLQAALVEAHRDYVEMVRDSNGTVERG